MAFRYTKVCAACRGYTELAERLQREDQESEAKKRDAREAQLSSPIREPTTLRTPGFMAATTASLFRTASNASLREAAATHTPTL